MPNTSRHGLLAKKVGMTRIFAEDGRHIPVTVLQVEGLQIIAQRTVEKEGYSALQVGGFAKKASRVARPELGHFKKAGVEPKQKLVEFRVPAGELPAIGTELKPSHFKAGQLVDVAGVTKGRGFTGVMFRWNFGGGRATHGNSISHRSHGSTGQRQDPGRVFKNKKMAGHYGNENVTTQNLEVVRVDDEQGLILLRGSVPGAKGGFIVVRDAAKTKQASAK
ncbi:MAG: 50S ribosomal protein L3 [Proteobacteria bacterium]|nr:50S ribosomal protein L3 [Pseudomonadota bacterium]